MTTSGVATSSRIYFYAQGPGEYLIDDVSLVRVGDPAQQIIKAGRKFQLICVADSGKSRLKRFISGSVAFDVMGRAETSVLNVR